MKLSRNTSQYDSTLDDAPSKKATIVADPFMFQILSGQLYSDPLLACVREIFANAFDSHEEAKKREGTPLGWEQGKYKPVEITLPTQIDPTLIIKDYGIGLSEEDVLRHTTSFGDSTKRDTNEIIGGFGLGFKSPMATTSQFTVIRRGENPEPSSNADKYTETTFGVSTHPDYGFECKQFPIRKPIVDAQGNSKPDRGITVKIPVSNNRIDDIIHNVYKVVRFFPQESYTITNASHEVFFTEALSLKTDSGKVFCQIGKSGCKHTANSSQKFFENYGQFYAVMGNLVYPISDNFLTLSFSTYSWDTLGNIYLHFPLGSLTLTPQRESLYEDTKTKKAIDLALILLCEKLHKYLQDETKIMGKSLWDYLSKPAGTKNSNTEKNTLLANFLERVHARVSPGWKVDPKIEALVQNSFSLDTDQFIEKEQEVDAATGNPLFDYKGDPVMKVKSKNVTFNYIEQSELHETRPGNRAQEWRSSPYNSKITPSKFLRTIFWRTPQVKQQYHRVKQYHLDNNIDLPSRYSYDSKQVMIITVEDEKYLADALKALENPTQVIDLSEVDPWVDPSLNVQPAASSPGTRSPAFLYRYTPNEVCTWNQTTEFPVYRKIPEDKGSANKFGKCKAHGVFYLIARNYTLHNPNSRGIIRHDLCELKNLEYQVINNFLTSVIKTLYEVSGTNSKRFPLVIVPYSRRGQLRKHIEESEVPWINGLEYLESLLPKYIKKRTSLWERKAKLNAIVSNLSSVFDFVPLASNSEYCNKLKEQCRVYKKAQERLQRESGIDFNNILTNQPMGVANTYSAKDYATKFFDKYPMLKAIHPSSVNLVTQYIQDRDELLGERDKVKTLENKIEKLQEMMKELEQPNLPI
jgi:hypothetical protein